MDDSAPSSHDLPRTPTRRLPVGAEPQPGGGVHFRVWAPAAREVMVEIDGAAPHRLTAEADGYFSDLVAAAGVGARYRYRLDGGEPALPDPASRAQPDGPHGSSEVIDPAGFAWSDGGWRGIERDRLIIYELHVGTFTPEGTWDAAMRHLPALAELGVTCIEMMPVADFPGAFGWGYDGVDLFAPTRLYGRPDNLRRFVDRAHALGLAVILDVVYNHLGPDGNYLGLFSRSYVTGRHATEWGDALNFDGPEAGPVREFFASNAGYWIDEYHFDGLRLDATHRIYDNSADHILAAIARRVRDASGRRHTFIAAENEAQIARLARPPADGGYGLDAIWNDDFHHAARVALTGRNEAYYSDFEGSPREFTALARHGFLFQGQYAAWFKEARGTPAFDLPGSRFVIYLQNHDQVANSGAGRRGHQLASAGAWRAMTAYLLLSPGIPLLFQGQEFAASAPFLFFADHHAALAALVKKGRREFLAQFPSLAGATMQSRLADPGVTETFRRCVLNHGERDRHGETLALHRDLITLRRERIGGGRRIDAATLSDAAWALRHFDDDGRDLLLIVNLGRDLRLASVAEPLLAPPEGRAWRFAWSSEDPRYGGTGAAEPLVDGTWNLSGRAAVALVAGD